MPARTLRTIERSFKAILDDKKIMLVTAIVVFALGVLASYVLASAAATRADVRYDNAAESALDTLGGHINTRLSAYQVLLRSSAGLINIAGRDALDADDWRAYVNTLSTEQSLDDLQGIGYSEFVPAEDLSAHQARLEREHGFDITIAPETERDAYTTISYLEPLNPENKKAIGFDMFSDPIRNQAMSLARDEGKVAMTLPVISVQDIDQPIPQKTILMYYPVYSTSVIPATTTERREQIIGYSYLLFRGGDLLSDYREFSNDGQVFARIIDATEPSDVKTIYESTGFNTDVDSIINRDMTFSGRHWNIALYLEGAQRPTMLTPVWIFAMGIAISALLAISLYLLLQRRNAILAEEHERRLNQTKNDLVALASHQLRTPATGTRQYIGMLIEEYFGPLTEEQRDIAIRAYRANERQLEIVDEILYVAKADSGQIFLNRTQVDIIKLLKDIVADSRDDAKKKNLTIKLSARRKSLKIDADVKYLTMIFENILSNSIKYSYPDSTIKVRVTMVDNSTAKLTFTDQGVGVSPEDQPELFKKFARIDNPLSHTEGGSGLGLYLAHKLVLAHEGEITVDSNIDKGSTFVVTLPIHSQHHKNVVQLTE